MDEKQKELLELQIETEKKKLEAEALRVANELEVAKQLRERNAREEREREEKQQLKEEIKKKEEEKVIAQKEAEEKEKKDREEYLASLPKKCHIRTFTFPDSSTKEFHSLCDGQDYTREDRPNNVLGLLTGEYVRNLCKQGKITETKDTIHFI